MNAQTFSKILTLLVTAGMMSSALAQSNLGGLDPYYDLTGNPTSEGTANLNAIAIPNAAAVPIPSPAKASLIGDFPAELSPNIPHGFILGSSSISRAYIVEVTPLSAPNIDGGFITQVIQNEFNLSSNQWNDVLRLTLGNSTIPVNVNVKVYKVRYKTT